MRIANREFSPKLWAVLLYLVTGAIMLALGNWQLGQDFHHRWEYVSE